MTTGRMRPVLALACIGCISIVAGRAHAGDEPPIQAEPSALAYLKAVHARVHRTWVDNFLAMASAQLPADHPVNVPSRAVTVDVAVAEDGRGAKVSVTTPSGVSEFDAAAVEVIQSAGPFPPAPDDLLSDDGKVHVSWTLARDDRRCSGMAIAYRKEGLVDAIPVLVAQGRIAVALARMQAADEPTREAALARFAQAWLDQADKDRDLKLAVQAARVNAGDDRGKATLLKAIGDGHDLEIAAKALGRAGHPLCPLVLSQLAGNTELRERALTVLRFGSAPECTPGLLGLAKDTSAPAAQRVAALEILDRTNSDDVRQETRALLHDREARVRAAASLVATRAGEGRGTVFRLTPQLRDSNVDVRAAAAAAIARAGGEASVAQLFLVHRETEMRPYELVSAELGRLSGADSAEMLGKFARSKRNRRVRVLATTALATRADEAARTVLTGLAEGDDGELRFLAVSVIDPEKRKAVATAPEGYDWVASYGLMAAGLCRPAATDWVLAQFSRLDPTARINVLSDWLAGAKSSSNTAK